MSVVGQGTAYELDALVVGAGFSGLFQLARLRELGFSVKLLEANGGMGGVWYANRYPGIRVDTPGPIYQYSSQDIWKEWEFSELYPSGAELREYFEHVDRKLELSRDIHFNTRVVAAQFNEVEARWTVNTADGTSFSTKYFVLCTGFGSKPLFPQISGIQDFGGECHHTAQWPQRGVDLSGKRVGVIGTGASGVQFIQAASREAASLTVFQRTPNMALPMRQRLLDGRANDELKASYPQKFAERGSHFAGFEPDFLESAALEVSDEQRTATFERLWSDGGFYPWIGNFYDVLFDDKANAMMYAFWREKVHGRVHDPVTAEILAPATPPHPFGVKRPSLEQGYFEVFNQDNVHLVDLREHPIQRIERGGVVTSVGDYPLDVLVFATGFDANTGGLTSIDIVGTTGVSLREKWADGVEANLGIATSGFPNMLFLYGPLSPAGFCNGPFCAETQAEEVAQFFSYLRENEIARFESTSAADKKWREHVDELFFASLFPKADSWYVGANVPGKPRQMLNYPGGVPSYVEKLTEWRERKYSGFDLTRG
jgi:cyclohexanone monooxygenase